MSTPTLQPQTLLALQYLFQTWKQDDAAQNNTLWITSQCIWLCDNNDITQTIDLTNSITSFLESDINNSPNTLEDTEQLEINSLVVNDTEEINPNLELEDIQEETLAVPIVSQVEVTPAEVVTELENNDSTTNITCLVDDLKQTPAPTARTLTNPFIGGTWKDQANRIFKFLSSPGRTLVSLNKKIEAYYCLGLLISKTNDPLEIKTFIQKAQSERKAKDTWKGALRIYELFKLRPKEVIFNFDILLLLISSSCQIRSIPSWL